MRTMLISQKSRGMTLVELMIALVLSLLVMGGAVSIFMGSKETFKLEEDLSRVQENFRYIADRLTKDVSVVGHSGCVLPYRDNSSTVNNRISGSGSVRDVISGTEGGDPTTPDALTLSYALTGTGADVVGGGSDQSSPINISTSTYLYSALADNFSKSEGDRVPVTLLVGNCDHGDLFVVTKIDTATPVPDGEAALYHETGVTVGGISNDDSLFTVPYGDINLSASKIFYVEDVTYEICTVGSETGLCVTRGGGNRELLMSDITNIQVKYGVDSDTLEDGNADSYVDWSPGLLNADITSIKVTLTMVLNQVSEKVYTFTIKMRNMGLDV